MTRKIALLIALTTIGLVQAFSAQTIRNTQNSVDSGKRSNLTVDPITHALQLDIPLAAYPQRGGNLPVSLSYSSKVWNIEHLQRQVCLPLTDTNDSYRAVYAGESDAGWTASLGFPYIAHAFAVYDNNGQLTTTDYQKTIARLTLVMPDGSRHELRKDDVVYDWDATITGKFYAVDGSRLVYDRDTDILYLPDGSRFEDVVEIGSGSGAWATGVYKDANGNVTTYDVDELTDTLGRVIEKPITAAFPTGDQSGAAADEVEYSTPGLGSATIDYKLRWQKLSDTGVISEHETDDTLRYKGDWTSSSCGSMPSNTDSLFLSQLSSSGNEQMYRGSVFDPVVLHEIELPNGQTYTFKYNIYGEITKIIYPTGGYERFEYATVPGISGWFDASISDQASRGVVGRWISPDGESESEQEYTYTGGAVEFPDGTKTEYVIYGRPEERLGYGFDNPLYGKIKEVRQYADGGALMGRKLSEWTVDGTVSGGPSSTVTYKTRNPRVVREIAMVFEPGETYGLASMIETEFDTNGDAAYWAMLNPKRVKTYDYVVVTASTASSASLATATGWFSSASPAVVNEADYLYDSNYKARNISGLVSETRVEDASGNAKAKTQITYDESGYGLSSSGTMPTAATGSWVDPLSELGSTIGAKRGQPTTTKSYYDITNSYHIETHSFFDQFGNLRKARDGRGNDTETLYDDDYAFAYPTKVISAVPDNGTNGSGSAFETTSTYDYDTALTLTTTDINAQTSSFEYDDLLLRLTKVTAPNDSETITEYGAGTSDSTRWVKVKSQIDTNNWSEAISKYDGIGRTFLTEKTDSNGNVFSETEYDEVGRVKRSTNPYKSGETKKWTTPGYDAAGRTVSVTSSDSSVVHIGFGLSTSGAVGITQTITDQAGKKRKGITNALGRMIRVVEDPDSSALATDYTFDIPGNLRKTVQGDQSRYFMHDALGRLLFAKQPEQDTNTSLTATDPITGNTAWSAKYLYDANSNITSTTDARNLSVSASYDKLNRITLRDYSDSAMPDVAFYYDGTGLSSVPNFSKGKTTKITSSVSETRNTSFDEMGNPLTHRQTTDGVNYDTAYTYNLSGALIEETYPSGRVVKNTLDADGQLAQVQSKKNATSGYWAYANSFTYDAAGAVKKMQLGNGHWETALYNDRLQVKEIGLGSTGATQDLLKLEFKYEGPDPTGTTADRNNGSMREQKITVPTVGSNTGFTATQTYIYDNLNRIQSAEEKVSGSTTWKQTFTLDRYGNRRLDAANTTTLGSCASAVCNPTISTSNNRFSTGQGYSYDLNGNVTVDTSGNQFFYDSENHQIEVKNSGNVSLGQYFYDGDGRRVKKVAGGEVTVFVYNGAGQLVAEYSTQIETTNAQVSYSTTDHLGSPRMITDANGAVTSRKDFAPFGETTTTSQRATHAQYGDPSIRQNFTGYEKDEESGLEYAQARYYNPAHGRFTSVDPLTASATIRDPQTLNRYSYVLNSPYKFTDPLGLVPFGSRGNPLINSLGGSGFIPPGEHFASGVGDVEPVEITETAADDAAQAISQSQSPDDVDTDEQRCGSRPLSRCYPDDDQHEYVDVSVTATFAYEHYIAGSTVNDVGETVPTTTRFFTYTLELHLTEVDGSTPPPHSVRFGRSGATEAMMGVAADNVEPYGESRRATVDIFGRKEQIAFRVDWVGNAPSISATTPTQILVSRPARNDRRASNTPTSGPLPPPQRIGNREILTLGGMTSP